jgi:hypothetical protein
MSSLYFGLDVFCLSEARVPDFAAVYTFTAAPVFHREMFRVQDMKFQPQWTDNIKPKKHVPISAIYYLA